MSCRYAPSWPILGKFHYTKWSNPQDLISPSHYRIVASIQSRNLDFKTSLQWVEGILPPNPYLENSTTPRHLKIGMSFFPTSIGWIYSVNRDILIFRAICNDNTITPLLPPSISNWDIQKALKIGIWLVPATNMPLLMILDESLIFWSLHNKLWKWPLWPNIFDVSRDPNHQIGPFLAQKFYYYLLRRIPSRNGGIFMSRINRSL